MPSMALSPVVNDTFSTITKDDCSYYGRANTTGFGIIRTYEGIPENILVNLIVSTMLLLVFVYLRRRFSDSKNISDGTDISSLLYGQSSSSRHFVQNSRWLWIRDLFKISDWDIYRNCSPDAYYYLLFHTYLIGYLVFMTIFSLAVILPVNFHGTQGISEQKFARTTIANLPPNSSLLWFHACASILFVLAGIIVAYLYTNTTQYYATEDVASRTLMIRGIRHSACDEEKLNEYFREAYPSFEVAHLTLVYNITPLQRTYKRRELNFRFWKQSEQIFQETGIRPVVYNNKCGRLCACCSKRIDAIDYYQKLYNTYKQRVENEYLHVKDKKCGLAFVTFSTPEEAHKHLMNSAVHGGSVDIFYLTIVFFAIYSNGVHQYLYCHCKRLLLRIVLNLSMVHRVRSDFRMTCLTSNSRPKTSTSQTLGIHTWTIHFAPNPRNIIWKNIPTSKVRHWFRIIIVNIILVIFMVFLTTPSIVMSTLDKIANKYRSLDPLKEVTKQMRLPVVLTSIVPVLLLRIFASAMPSLVSITSLLEKQWKKSSLDKSMMVKLFVFLVMMILVLPSLGLTSIEGFLRWVFDSENDAKHNSRIRWMCMFLPDNGAFFVNYIITSAFIGAAIELLRLADLFYYIYMIVTAKSAAERRVIRNGLQFPYRFGVQYAWTSAVFCVIVAYSIACPLITPIGLIYMLIKRAVDKYNLVFVYDSEIADKSVHRLAGNFIVVALIIQQLTLLFFVLVRSESLNHLSMTLLISFILTSGVYMGFSCFDWCNRWSLRKRILPTAILPETAGTRQRLDDLGELEEMEGRETKQKATSHYVPTILNACIEEFNASPSETTVSRSSTRERMQQGNYGTIDQTSQQPIIVGTGDENDMFTD